MDSSDQAETAFDTRIYDSQAKYVASIKHNELITKPKKNYYNNNGTGDYSNTANVGEKVE